MWVMAVCVAAAARAPAGARAAAGKTYRKPATVPAAKIPAATTMRADVWPVPEPREIERGIKFVRDTFAEDYKNATTTTKKKEIARELLRQGMETRDNAAARYVLLTDAIDMAAMVGEAGTVVKGIEELSRSFLVDPVEMKAIKLNEAGKSAFTREQVDALVGGCLSAEEQAIAADQYDPAGRLLATADGTAERAHRADLRSKTSERKKELDALRAGHDEYVRAREVLAKKSDDAAASLVAGRYLCFVRGDWDGGLPMLAAGADEMLRSAAAKDLSNPIDAGARAEVGGLWWDLAARQAGVMRGQAQRRAVYWYRQANGLSGASGKAVSDRIRAVQTERLRAMGLTPGLLADIYDGQHEEKKRLTRVDPRIDFEWPAKRTSDDGVPKSNFSIAWTGAISVPQAGAYTFVLIANDGGTVAIDGNVVVDLKDGQHKRSGERGAVKLDEGVHRFQVKLWNNSGLARIRLFWITPGAAGEEVISADAFWHEGGEVASGRVE
jgi:hypothetical protein